MWIIISCVPSVFIGGIHVYHHCVHSGLLVGYMWIIISCVHPGLLVGYMWIIISCVHSNKLWMNTVMIHMYPYYKLG
jgi:hypothetical protein